MLNREHSLVELLDTSALWSMFWDALIYNRFRGPDATPTSAVPWQLYFHVVMDAISSVVHIAVLIAEIALTEDIFDSKTNVLIWLSVNTGLLICLVTALTYIMVGAPNRPYMGSTR
ncbi:hypothetical protein HWV62_636 [Athelia sp. TMB]|nr:hypothetical protein HWV62_4261 [Athelia sp. TMB]KAF7978446.1 hypothetical protein HWV62_636 [Athelia sp. TMB]